MKAARLMKWALMKQKEGDKEIFTELTKQKAMKEFRRMKIEAANKQQNDRKNP